MIKDEKAADQVSRFINENLGLNLHIQALAIRFQLSRFTLQRVFKQVYHQSVHKYVLEKRLEKAHHLLITTDLPLKELIGEVGFRSRSSFTRIFHHRFGISPIVLREKIGN